MAPSTPPPPRRVVLAALTIASTANRVMSPRTSFSCGSGILRFMDQAEAARVLVKRPGRFHRPRIAVEGKRLGFRMVFPPLGKRASDAALAGDVEGRCEFAHVMQNEKTAGREQGIPEI